MLPGSNGFAHRAGSRIIAFERIAADATRPNCSVSADLILSRTLGIRSQELPLLCLRFLEHQGPAAESHDLTFAKEDMRVHVDNCAAERVAAQKMKSSRRLSGAAAPPSQLLRPVLETG